MENEGIMSLPEGQAVQNQGPANQPVYVSSADSYEAALAALGMSTNDPTQVEAVRQAVRESIEDLDLSPTELDALLEVLEYMSQKPDEYPQIRQRLIDSGMMDPDDLPEAYDPAYIGMAILALTEYQAQGVEGAKAPMEMGPPVEGPAPMAMAEGGLADMAKYLASKGRNGDSILAHITPSEARLLKAMGGSGTINPQTGLPEFFLKKLFKGVKKAVKKLLKNPIVRTIATVALATVLGPAAAGVVGAVTGTAAGVALSTSAAAAATALASTAAAAGVSAMAGEKLNAKSLLINAATSYFGAGGTIGGVNPVGKVAELAGKLPGVTPGGAVAQGIGAGLTSAGIGKLAGMGTQEALGMGLQSGIMTGIQTARANQAAARDMAAPKGGGADQGTVIEGQYNPATEGMVDRGFVEPGTSAAPPQAPGSSTAYSYNTGTTGPGLMTPMGATGTPGATYAYNTGTAPGFLSGIGGPAPTTSVASAMPTTAGGPGLITSAGAPAGAPATAAGGQSTFMGRAGDFFRNPSFESFTDAFLVNPNAAKGTLARYVPGVATALGVSALTGGFKAGEAEENPLFNRDYTGSDFIRDNPQLFQGGLRPTVLQPYNPIVETPSYGLQGLGPSATQPLLYQAPRIPVTPVPVYTPPPGTVTNMPGGIPQPYNVSGLYTPQPRPPGYAEGGDVDVEKEDLLDMLSRKLRGESKPTRGGPTSREPTGPTSPQVTYLPNPFGKSVRVVLGPSGSKGRPRKELYSPVVMDENFRTIPNPNYRPENEPEVQRLLEKFREMDRLAEGRKKNIELVKKAAGGPVNSLIRQAANNPQGVAETEAMLFAGPQAAQQAGMAVRALGQQGIMGAQKLRDGGQPTHFPRKTGAINGPGTGTSDSIPAMLSDGEFVFTAKAVRNAGNGSRRKGARRMYKLMKMLEGGNVKGK